VSTIAPARVVLEAAGIRKQFPGVVALDDVSLRLRSGEIQALVGENGAGKSTLIKVLTGVYQPDAGTVTIDGAEHVVEPGDTIDFQSDKPHGYRNDGEHPVRLLMVVLLPG